MSQTAPWGWGWVAPALTASSIGKGWLAPDTGLYVMRMVVDATNQVDEIDETNNEKLLRLRVIPGDLACGDIRFIQWIGGYPQEVNQVSTGTPLIVVVSSAARGDYRGTAPCSMRAVKRSWTTASTSGAGRSRTSATTASPSRPPCRVRARFASCSIRTWSS